VQLSQRRDTWEARGCRRVLALIQYRSGDDVLESLVLANNLYAMLELFLGRLVAHIGEVAVYRHDGGSCGMSSCGARAMIAVLNALWRCRAVHSGKLDR